MKYGFTIKGRPLIWQRPKGFYDRAWGKMRHYDPQAGERKTLAMTLLAARQAARKGVLSGDLRLQVLFHYKGHGKRRMDLSNMIKALEDSGNGVLWEDDSQIVKIDAEKEECPEGREQTVVELEEIKKEI